MHMFFIEPCGVRKAVVIAYCSRCARATSFVVKPLRKFMASSPATSTAVRLCKHAACRSLFLWCVRQSVIRLRARSSASSRLLECSLFFSTLFFTPPYSRVVFYNCFKTSRLQNLMALKHS